MTESLGIEERRTFMVLREAESAEYERLGPGSFPRSTWSGIDWTSCGRPEQVLVSGEEEAAGLIGTWLSEVSARDSLVVVFWGNIAVPAVAMTSSSAAAHAEEILYTSDDLWLFAVDEGVLIEYLHDGRLTMARVPD
ncbi:hypothetical protein [Streptomyces sp. NPDC003730]